MHLTDILLCFHRAHQIKTTFTKIAFEHQWFFFLVLSFIYRNRMRRSKFFFIVCVWLLFGQRKSQCTQIACFLTWMQFDWIDFKCSNSNNINNSQHQYFDSYRKHKASFHCSWAFSNVIDRHEIHFRQRQHRFVWNNILTTWGSAKRQLHRPMPHTFR